MRNLDSVSLLGNMLTSHINATPNTEQLAGASQIRIGSLISYTALEGLNLATTGGSSPKHSTEQEGRVGTEAQAHNYLSTLITHIAQAWHLSGRHSA